MARVSLDGLVPAWLANAAEDEGTTLSVGRGADAELVPGKAAESPPSLGFRSGFPTREIGLVDEDVAGEDDSVLDSVDDEEGLGKPVEPGGIGVPVVEGRGPDGMELEQVEEELDPFRERYLPGVEYRPGEGVELPPARLAFAYQKAGFLREAVPPEPRRPAVGARFRGEGIDEGDLLGRSPPVLGVVPFRQRRNHHRG